jgi:hypothetical protein
LRRSFNRLLADEAHEVSEALQVDAYLVRMLLLRLQLQVGWESSLTLLLMKTTLRLADYSCEGSYLQRLVVLEGGGGGRFSSHQRFPSL